MADRISYQMRCYLCVLCKKGVITEGTKKTSPDFGDDYSYVPDHNNCDLSSYSDYVVVGGALLKRRMKKDFGGLEEGAWVNSVLIRSEIKKGDVITLSELHKYYGKIPFGGICDECMKKEENAQTIELFELEEHR